MEFTYLCVVSFMIGYFLSKHVHSIECEVVECPATRHQNSVISHSGSADYIYQFKETIPPIDVAIDTPGDVNVRHCNNRERTVRVERGLKFCGTSDKKSLDHVDMVWPYTFLLHKKCIYVITNNSVSIYTNMNHEDFCISSSPMTK